MKTIDFYLNDERFLVHMSDSSATAFKVWQEARKNNATDENQKLARFGAVAMTEKDREAFSLFALMDREVGLKAGATEEQIEQAHKTLEAKHGCQRMEIREKFRTKAIVL